MNRRIRLVAGILALVASTFAHAETVMAVTCTPEMDMDMDMPTAEAGTPHAPADHGMPGSSAECCDDGENERHCPFGPAAAAQGCAGVASLPTHAVNPIAASPEGVVAGFIEQAQHDLLLANALYRPPRA